MARTKEISHLLNGIMGNEPKPLPSTTETGEIPTETLEALQVTPEMEEALNEARKRKVGRPKAGTRNKKNPYEGRATFVVDNRLIRKVKYISLADTRLLKDVIAEALSDYIAKWEGENSPIELPKKR